MTTTVTLATLRTHTANHWSVHADNWITVTDNDGVPLWQFKRGTSFVFGNASLPRMAWTEFQRMPSEDKRTLLMERQPIVLKVRGADTFLVRLPQ